MFWLGLLLAICYVPGYTGASVPTQWAVLSAFLPACLWYRSSMTTGHKLFLLWGTYAVLTLEWMPNLYSAVGALWFLAIWALSYHLGTIITDLRSLWKGLALGLSVSTVVAIAQALDYSPVEAVAPFTAAGLFFNPALLGVISGLVLVALATERLWWYMPPLVINLILSGSRGGLVILALGICAIYSRLLAAAALIAGGLAFALGSDLADSQRLQIWGVTLRDLTFWGHGVGSFTDLYYVRHTGLMLIRPEYVHNDPLQLVYELGIGAIFPIVLFGTALCAGGGITGPIKWGSTWPIMFAFCACALFFFPLYTPLTAFIGLMVAGNRISAWDVVRRECRDRRPSFLSRFIDEKPGTDLDGSKAVPLVVRT